eukprot:GHUV01022915.1.p1 GENE.GHUV01022915.1~~GHUV01022915.1.p1  ORF type:complete len:149 (+),score=9.48 GHUV01022915.1:66-512(+)
MDNVDAWGNLLLGHMTSTPTFTAVCSSDVGVSTTQYATQNSNTLMCNISWQADACVGRCSARWLCVCTLQTACCPVAVLRAPPAIPPSTIMVLTLLPCLSYLSSRLEDYAKRGNEPIEDEVQIYTWPDATLRELADLIAEVRLEARGR